MYYNNDVHFIAFEIVMLLIIVLLLQPLCNIIYLASMQ